MTSTKNTSLISSQQPALRRATRPALRRAGLATILAAFAHLVVGGSPQAQPASAAAPAAGAVPVFSVSSADAAVAVPIQDLLAGSVPTGRSFREVQRFYRERDYAAVWIEGTRISDRARGLIARFDGIEAHGLNPADYRIDQLRELVQQIDQGGAGADRLALFDVMLSHAAWRLARDLSGARVVDVRLPTDARPQARTIDGYGLLQRMALGERPADVLAELIPRSEAYVGLLRALARYRAFVAAGGWPTVPEGRTLEPGTRDPRIVLVRRRLAVTDGAASVAASLADHYDPALREAVKRFQRRHGITDDGRIGRLTVQAMNVTAEARQHQIEANLDRMRAFPPPGDGPEIFVNIPEYRLRVIERERVVMDMAVVVGREVRGTPLMSSRITEIIVNPTWTVPTKLAREDLLPQLQQNPQRMVDRGFRIFRRGTGTGRGAQEIDLRTFDWRSLQQDDMNRFLVRQDSGPRNALGRLRFTLINTPSIYLHDTPDRHYFARDVRSMSSGCVRVERPLELAEYVLRHNRDVWSKQRIEQAIAATDRRSVPLAQSIPVHLVYVTAWSDGGAEVNFREDIYSFDEQTVAAIEGRSRALASLRWQPRGPR